jgi:hypothetical protein
MKPSITIETLQQIMDDMQSARNTINKTYGFLPGELWLKIDRARSALHLAFLRAHAVQSSMKAEALEAKDQP